MVNKLVITVGIYLLAPFWRSMSLFFHLGEVRQIPEFDRTVITTRAQKLAVGAEGYGVDDCFMPLQRGPLLPRYRVPELHEEALCCCKDLAIRAEGKGVNALFPCFLE